MLTIGLGPAFAGGGSGGGGATEEKPTLFNQSFIEATATAKIVDNSITEFPLVDTSMLTTMYNFFDGCLYLKSVPLLNTSNVTKMGYMFRWCESLKTIPPLDTTKVTSMTEMFKNCSSLVSVPALNTSLVTSMPNMFEACGKLEIVTLLDMVKVTDALYMFFGCSSLKYCHLTNLKTKIEFDNSPLLEKSSVLFIFANAQKISSSKTIKLHADTFNQLTADEIAIATQKGFSVVSA